ncbi:MULTISPECIES: ABC transporter ATP-binding protein [unclassified Phaeobacter]|uniref:ABC transporter ATP-binding protein n=1 Tax=unclassified Phaeobacter TaxID=2621772 RepID=UPI003A8C06EA
MTGSALLSHIISNKCKLTGKSISDWEDADVNAIEIDDLEMRFGSFAALSDVNLAVSQGEFVTLLGPSGCGKTTLLKLLSGFLKPTKGRISMAGQNVTSVPPEARDTALCFQSYALFPHLTVQENIEFGMRQKRIPRQEREARLARVAAQLDLEPQLQKLPNQLSGGQQQRVALARALVMQPAVILFDEPLSNLDAKLRDAVRLEIRRIQRDNNLTAIYVTHDQSEALAMSDRIVVLRAGRIEQIGTPRDIYDRPATSFVADFIGAANVMDATVLGVAAGGGIRIDTPLGEMISTAGSRQTSGKVRVCWRPENAQIGGSGPNSFSLSIRDRSFQGTHTDLFAHVRGVDIRLQARGHDVSEGDAIACTVPAEHLVVLEALE